MEENCGEYLVRGGGGLGVKMRRGTAGVAAAEWAGRGDHLKDEGDERAVVRQAQCVNGGVRGPERMLY